MDLVYEIQNEDKGKSYIEKIEISGNTKTRDKVIRRELAVSPGEVFDMVRVKRSKGRLEQMQYFDKVETEIDPTDIPNRKNLIIGVEEGSTGNFELGAGFSSVDNLVGFWIREH
jgi:outer membrane protein insertion porin family